MNSITKNQKARSIEYLKSWKKSESHRLSLLKTRKDIDAELHKIKVKQDCIKSDFQALYSDERIIDLHIKVDDGIYRIRRDVGFDEIYISAIPIYSEDG